MSLLLTRMQNMRETSNFGKNNDRRSSIGALRILQSDNNASNSIVTPQLQNAALGSAGRLLQTPVLDGGGAVITSTRTVSVAVNQNSSRMVDIAFTTYEFGFAIIPSLFGNNEIAMQQYFEQKMESNTIALSLMMDTAALTAINNARTQIANDLGLFTFNGTNHEMVSTNANASNLIASLSSLMGANDFVQADNINVLGGFQLDAEAQTYVQDGAGNNQNKLATLMGKDFFTSNRVTNNTGNRFTGFAIQKGDTGILYRLAPDGLAGRRTLDGHVWGTTTLPYLDIPVDTYFYDGAIDASANSGAASAHLTRTAGQYYSFAVDVAYLTAHNADQAANASGVLRFAASAT